MAGEQEKLDPDILKAKMDILRNRNGGAEKSSQQNNNNQQPIEMSDLMSDVVKANKAGRTDAEQSGIPTFDISKRILSQHRKATASRRAAPVKTRPESPLPSEVVLPPVKKSIGSAVTRPSSNWLIAEIVARDIKRLCHGQGLAV